jgi:hypothetical protein
VLEDGIPDRLHTFLNEWGNESESTLLPKRVLDLGEDCPVDSNLKLRETSTREYGRYVALSHCWQRDMILQTTEQTLARRKENIDFSGLSTTFQDAIVTCRLLGVRFLWIDSLCIIQNSKDDWEDQSSKMHIVYSGAFFTITMHGHARNPMIHHDIQISSGSGAIVHVRRVALRTDLTRNLSPGPTRFSPSYLEPPNEQWNRLSQRAWCYQERALSRRNLHFTGDELVIEDGGQIKWCQCSLHFTPRPQIGFSGSIQSGNFFYPGRDDLAWREVISQYTTRMFSQKWDLLPGIAGLAQTFADNGQLGSYVAGLWTKDLLSWLCWRSCRWDLIDSENLSSLYRRGGCDRALRPRRLSPSKEHYVPTFSWVSRFGPCRFISEPLNTVEFQTTAEIAGFDQQQPAVNSLGRVIYSFIDIKGPIYPCTHYSTVNKPHSGCRSDEAWVVDDGFSSRWNTSVPMTELFELVRICGKRYEIDAMDDVPSDNTTVYLLELYSGNSNDLSSALQTIMLVLVPEDEESSIVMEQLVREKRSANSFGVNIGSTGDRKLPRMRRIGIGAFQSHFELAEGVEGLTIRLV